ncbi:hypothetical protein GGR58DRAFT_474438 [Xylaria digitata]|nr:hypothetical protein GGR58DRAFT_474438 [Xylaria digitata]
MARFSTPGNRGSQQRDVSPCAAVDMYTSQWTQTLNEIKLQYVNTKRSEAACFQEEWQLLLEKQNSLRNELQSIEERIQHLQSNYDTIVKDRRQAYATRLEAHVKTISEYNFTSQISVQMGQQVEQTLNTPIEIENAAISPRDDDVPNAQVQDTIVVETQSPDSASSGERSTQPNPTEAQKAVDSTKRPRLRRRRTSRFAGSHNQKSSDLRSDRGTARLRQGPRHRRQIEKAFEGLGDSVSTSNHPDCVRTADANNVFEGDMAGHDNVTFKGWANDRETADLDHHSDTKKDLGIAEAGSDYVATSIVQKVCQDGQPGALGDAPLEESEGIGERTSVDSSSENRVHNNSGGLERLNPSVESSMAENPNVEYESPGAFKANISYILGDPAEELQTPAVFASTTQTMTRPPPFGTMAFDCTLPLTTLPALRETTSTSRQV